MSGHLPALMSWAPAFALVLARVGPMMAVLPGLGESAAPAIVRAGGAVTLAVLLLPVVYQRTLLLPSSGLIFALMIASEVVTGLWFGWLARMIVLALPIAGQFAGYLVGLSSVLQTDPELGAQSGVIGTWYELAVPVLVLGTGLYRLPLRALSGFFQLVPPGHLLPSGVGVTFAVRAVGTAFGLALRLAAPFVIAALGWYVAMGLTARIVSRIQIYFASMPGQIVVGLILLGLSAGTMTLVWQNEVSSFFSAMPGLR